MVTVASDVDLEQVDRWWRAANYLSVGQIYLLDNPLLGSRCGRSTSSPAAGPLGDHAGSQLPVRPPTGSSVSARSGACTSPARTWRAGVAASTWLEGTYTETYADVTQDRTGMRRLFRRFSFPGGIRAT